MQIQISSRRPIKSNYIMYGLNWKSNNRPLCLLECDWFYWDMTFRSTVQILCQMHDNIIMFQWEYIHCNNATIPVSNITNYIFTLCLERFNNHKLRITLLCLNFTINYNQNSIVTLHSNTRKPSTTWARESFGAANASQNWVCPPLA